MTALLLLGQLPLKSLLLSLLVLPPSIDLGVIYYTKKGAMCDGGLVLDELYLLYCGIFFLR